MKSLLINTAKISAKTITAHSRNALILANELDITLISTSEELSALNRSDYSMFIVVGAAFYPKTAEIEAWIRDGAIDKMIWINNEYQVSPNSEYSRLFKDYDSLVISNNTESSNKIKGYNEFEHVNINALLFDQINRPILKKYDLCYFGGYRPGRRLYLQKYFSRSEFHISSSKKNLRRINQLCGVNSVFCDKFSWTERRETLNLFKFSLYIEDEHSHENYTCLANRFYECLKCNVVLLFDKSCKRTIELSNYIVPEKFFVEKKEDLEQKVTNLDYDLSIKEQKDLWYKIAVKERKEVLITLNSLLK